MYYHLQKYMICLAYVLHFGNKLHWFRSRF